MYKAYWRRQNWHILGHLLRKKVTYERIKHSWSHNRALRYSKIYINPWVVGKMYSRSVFYLLASRTGSSEVDCRNYKRLFGISNSWVMQLNALERSVRVAAAWPILSSKLFHFSVIFIRQCWALKVFLKPRCYLKRSHLSIKIHLIMYRLDSD